jgi:hypothetical protein
VIVLPYRDHTVIRFRSLRTGETLFELRMIERSLIVWGERYRPSEFDATLSEDGRTVALVGTLRDSCGRVVTFGGALDVRASYSVQIDELPADYDQEWRRDST